MHPGVMAAQYYKKRSAIELAVGDLGVGFLSSLKGTYPELDDDVSAILRASEYGVSRFGHEHRGAGLAETIESTTRVNGTVTITSGSAQVKFTRNDQLKRDLKQPSPGTMVNLNIRM